MEEAAMNGTRVLAALAIAIAAGVLGASSAATSGGSAGDTRYRGGYLEPSSLDGINPTCHLDIFANPALARAYYGFVRGRDGSWQVENNCHIPN
jgi:hypothetical protein